jgi:hypothetical protein
MYESIGVCELFGEIEVGGEYGNIWVFWGSDTAKK